MICCSIFVDYCYLQICLVSLTSGTSPFNYRYGLKVDIWAAGVITYILLCGFPPFRGYVLLHQEAFTSAILPMISLTMIQTLILLNTCCHFHSSGEDQEALFQQILKGQLDFPAPYWDNVSDTAKVCIWKCFTDLLSLCYHLLLYCHNCTKLS